MKKVKMLINLGVWKKGIQIMDNIRARSFCKKGWAIEIKDLGRHFGRSKYSYKKGRKTKMKHEHEYDEDMEARMPLSVEDELKFLKHYVENHQEMMTSKQIKMFKELISQKEEIIEIRYEDLRKEIKTKELKALCDIKTKQIDKITDVVGMIKCNFVWDETPEGRDYWKGICFKLHKIANEFTAQITEVEEKIKELEK